MYNAGTVTTTANSTKLIGTGTKWKDNNSRVSAEQVILIKSGTTVYINSIRSVQSNTELTLSFNSPAAVNAGTYEILTTMVNSVSDAANKIVAMNVANVQFSDILNRIMTETGVIDVKLPDGTVRKTRTEAERDKLLDGKASLDSSGSQTFKKEVRSEEAIGVWSADAKQALMLSIARGTPDIYYRIDGATYNITLPSGSGPLMRVGDFGVGSSGSDIDIHNLRYNGFFTASGFSPTSPATVYFGMSSFNTAKTHGMMLSARMKTLRLTIIENNVSSQYDVYHTGNTTKDANGNLKAASPIVKVFADHIETNDEAEGVTMQKLGTGHYLIKGVVGFNADGAWGINNGFVIPQDHNGKNMVLIDYEVRPDGDIEVFVFHQQNVDMPERFQNKRIKYIDKDGNPVYYENYEPCDVPESRWIDMRVEMPVNSIYNLKQAEAERLAKEEAERQAEEAKNAEIEAEEDI
ncbi:MULTISPECIES: phage tail fiber protein [unclassified Providencia]|uniref:phage tail fiber protein n=1 Tax=unclassified Providencia TaxID=2633465 RepID=UPI00234B7454|nr:MULTISPECIES: hypothetical protein [unclassified Providencia]